MKQEYYLKNFFYSLFFYAFVSVLLMFSSQNSPNDFKLYFIGFGLISSALYPNATALIERIAPVLMKPTHWGRWVGFIVLLFAIPLGLIGIFVKPRRSSK